MKLSRPLLVRLAILLALVGIAAYLFLRTMPRLRRYRAVDAACTAVERGDWQTALSSSEGLVGPDSEGLRAAQCRCLALLQTDGKKSCVGLLEGLLDDPRTDGWLPRPELTSLVVADRGDRGEPGAAADLAHRGAVAYPEDGFLLLQELTFRSRTEDEQSVLQEMEQRLPEAGGAEPTLRLELAQRHIRRNEWRDARELIGTKPDRFPPHFRSAWYSLDTNILAGLGDVEGLDATFEEWKEHGGDPARLDALHAVMLSGHQLQDPKRSTLDRLRDAARHGDRIDPVLLKLVYLRLIGTLVVSGAYDEALATYDRAVDEVGDLEVITREDIQRSETQSLFGENRLAELRGTIRLRVPDHRPGDTIMVSPALDETVDSAYVPINLTASGTAQVERGVGTWPQRWVLRDAAGRVAGSGAVWANPDASVDVDVVRHPPTTTTERTASLAHFLSSPEEATGSPHRRVFQVILDCGDWRLVEYGLARGEMPFFAQAIRRGRRAVLDSVPPFTATAVAKLVYPKKSGVRSLFDLVHQLGGEIEGLNFVGRNPFAAVGWVLPKQAQIFETFAEHGYSTVNLLRSHGGLEVGRQAQVRGPGDEVHQLPGYRSSRKLTPAEQDLLGLQAAPEKADTPADLALDFLREMAADFDVLDRLAQESTIDYVALRVASLDLLTHTQFQAMTRTEQDDGDTLLYRTYRYMDQRLSGVASHLHPGDVLIVMSDHGIRTPMEHDQRALFIALGDDVTPGRIDGSPPIQEVTGWVADLMGVETDWPGAGTADWIARPPETAAEPASVTTRAATSSASSAAGAASR